MNTLAPSTVAPVSGERYSLTPAEEELVRAAAALAAQAAAETDRDGLQGETALERLGALGALRLGLDRDAAAAAAADGGSDLSAYLRLLESVAGECMSSAFSLWAHRMVIEYLRAAGGFDALLDELLAGRRAGSIAMATAMQEISGVGAVPTLAVREGDGYRVTGRIAWASNIAPGSVVVFPARVASSLDDATDSGERVILVTTIGSEGLSTREVQDLLALGATRSAMLQFEGVFVGAEAVVANSFDACRARRSTHLLLQAAFCAGLAGRSLEEAAKQLQGPGGVLAARHAQLAQELQELDQTLHAYIDGIDTVDHRSVTVLRYQIARLAGVTTRHELTLVGGRGYVTTSATNRRLREASFLSVQSPSEVQLLQELETYGVYPTETYTL
ncbi:alkylation response protein AidB-like acyl-CoA dehydrogenase [Leucobacter exalbidus]|uniref:Alkylation response protein AidB-like acyl-CoA dehydrogenase n=1 Tax=Leucobacter exalbidus TaxID=662960 RepID=A0A940T4B8_9MICO|nr:acyl-CoA dehydrogenase family protein [Leucobacter exalbidus]MBP1326748.1 alkylation response protein AidB-like acyl-CoA dehydrogenase [Leucobacter exalbidus]